MPLGSKLGGENMNRKISKGENTDKGSLTTKQADYIYRKVESGNLINKNMMRQEIDQDIELDKIDRTSGEENLYRELIGNNAGKIETTSSQMEQWSLLSNVINYVQYNRHPKNFHTMSIRPMHKMKNKTKGKKEEKEKSISQINFRDTSDRLKEEYLDRYKGVKSEILSTTRVSENSDLSMIYLGKTNIVKENKIITEQKFPISEQGYTTGNYWTVLNVILLDTGSSNSFMSKSHYLCCKSLHSLPKFASNTQRIQVGNGQYVSILFIIPIIVDIHSHRFKTYTLVSEIHENIDLVLGIKNVFESEGVLPKEKIVLKPKKANIN